MCEQHLPQARADENVDVNVKSNLIWFLITICFIYLPDIHLFIVDGFTLLSFFFHFNFLYNFLTLFKKLFTVFSYFTHFILLF